MKYCIHCGSELEDEDKFCVHCGLSQSSAPESGCQQEAVGQTSVSPASAAASKKPINRAVIVLSVALAAALVVIVCLVLFMRPSSDEEPFAALAFKIATDPFVGRLCFLCQCCIAAADS